VSRMVFVPIPLHLASRSYLFRYCACIPLVHLCLERLYVGFECPPFLCTLAVSACLSRSSLPFVPEFARCHVSIRVYRRPRFSGWLDRMYTRPCSFFQPQLDDAFSVRLLQRSQNRQHYALSHPPFTYRSVKITHCTRPFLLGSCSTGDSNLCSLFPKSTAITR
jgi:hypothetical protein